MADSRSDKEPARDGRRMGHSPITYELDGRQYVVFGGSILYAWTLPRQP